MELKTTDSVVVETANNQFVTSIYQELKDSLFQGWQDFNNSENSELYSNFFEFISQAGFYEGDYRQLIPNPAYDNAVKIVGKYFLETARKLDIQFDEIFPGSFSASTESHKGDIEVRLFQLKAFYRKKPLCLLSLKFPHGHEKFGFPLPPELEIVELYQ